MSLEQAWTDEVRRAAVVAVQIAAARREAGDRTFRYFLRTALGHGVSVAEVALAAGLSRDEVVRLADPAVA